MAPESLKLRCTSGEIVAKVGDHFVDHNGEWEIVSFKDERTYSPSEIGGTPIVVIKPVGQTMPSWFDRYANNDGTINFCGDTVAAALLDGQDGKRRDARGAVLRA
jgi:hypothetical protein